MRGVGWPAEATPAMQEPHHRAPHTGAAERPRTGPFRVQAHGQEPRGEMKAHVTHTGPHITNFPAWLRTVITLRQVHCQAEHCLIQQHPLLPVPLWVWSSWDGRKHLSSFPGLSGSFSFFDLAVQSQGWLFATPWTVAYQASLSMGFSRQQYRSGLPFPSPGDLPDSGIKPMSLALAGDPSGFFATCTTWVVSFQNKNKFLRFPSSWRVVVLPLKG